jgi:tetratricopeptide (TPR) repeat protein
MDGFKIRLGKIINKKIIISMKKFALGLLCLILVVGSINAQEGKKALKKGGKMLEKYASNAIDNADQLDEGLMLVEKAFEDEEVKSSAKYYNALGAAYNAVASGQINAKLIDKTFTIANGELAMKAMDAFKKAYSMTDKKGEQQDALEGLQATESHLNNIGIYYFQDNDYAHAFDYFNGAVMAYETLKELGGESRLDDEADRKDHFFYTGAAGYYGEKGAAAIPVLEKLEMEGTDKGLVYEALYNLYAGTDKEKAVGYLEKGRTAFPDDTGLLFAEINYYLQEGQLEILTDKLKAAIEKEPDNVTIYTTLGNVNDQMNQKEREAGNFEKADEYFAEALKYYTLATEKDPANFDAVYSQGALYYNKAASYTNRINELANDFSSEGTKKYDALKDEMDSYFDQAMPFFTKAIGMNPNDLNTLIALREIYARKNDMDKVSEYKARIDAVSNGGN